MSLKWIFNPFTQRLQAIDSASGSGIDIEDEGSPEGTATTLDFVGSDVSAVVSGGVATITVSGTGGSSSFVDVAKWGVD